MSLFDKEVSTEIDEMGDALSKSARDLFNGLNEEIHPRHMEEASISAVSVLMLMFMLSLAVPYVDKSSTPAALAMSSTETSVKAISASALTEEQITSILGLLKSFNADDALVNNVNAALRGHKPAAVAAVRFCHAFARDLRVGDSGEDVSALQKALREGGFPTSESGDFDEPTASAVVQFQEKYKDEVLTPHQLSRGTGYVGSATRSKLNLLYRCQSSLEGTSTSGKPSTSTTTTGEATNRPIVTEQVKCVFHGATTEQKCVGRSERLDATFSCSGVGRCVAEVKGYSGTVLLWQSSCNSNRSYTTLDGRSDYAEFRCASDLPTTTTVDGS